MRILFSILTSFILLSSCGADNASNESTPFDSKELIGNWTLNQEIFNEQTLDCKDNPIKTIYSFHDNGYFIVYDDLTATTQSDIGNLQTHFKGQYTIDNNTLNLSYMNGDSDVSESLTIVSVGDNALELKNTSNNKTQRFIK